MEPILFIPLLISFFGALFVLPIWIRKAKNVGLKGKDMQKLSGEEVAEGGGVPVIFAFVIGVLAYVFIKTFYFNDSTNQIEIFALLIVVLIAGFVGLIDDIFGWRIGLTKKTKIFFMLFASIPLIVINAGVSRVFIPFTGVVNLGLFYPLLLIPLGILATSVTFNILAGYNGLESSQGILLLSALSYVSWKTGNTWLSLISLCFILCLLAFYIFNKYPATIFPGDSLTYSVGAMIGIMAILGNMERIALFFFIPYIIEAGLKLRGGLKKQSFAKINSDGGLDVPYDKFYGLEHISIFLIKKIKNGGRVWEYEVVYLINAFQILIIVLGLLIFKDFIFI